MRTLRKRERPRLFKEILSDAVKLVEAARRKARAKPLAGWLRVEAEIEVDLWTMRCEFALSSLTPGQARKRLLDHADHVRRNRNEAEKLGLPTVELDRATERAEDRARSIEVLKPRNTAGEAAALLADMTVRRLGLESTLTESGPFCRLTSLYSEIVTEIHDQSLFTQCRKVSDARKNGELGKFQAALLEGVCTPRSDAEVAFILKNRVRPR